MDITVTITIPDQLLVDCANTAAERLFTVPRWSDEKGPRGYQHVVRHVEEAVGALDLRPLAEETARRLAPGIVQRAVEQKLREMAKKAIQEATKDGSLL